MRNEKDKQARKPLGLNAETIRILDSKEIVPENLERAAGASGLRPTCVPDTDFSCYICSIHVTV